MRHFAFVTPSGVEGRREKRVDLRHLDFVTPSGSLRLCHPERSRGARGNRASSMGAGKARVVDLRHAKMSRERSRFDFVTPSGVEGRREKRVDLRHRECVTPSPSTPLEINSVELRG
jgi:hypothetical protein